jgi:hypothetical protein
MIWAYSPEGRKATSATQLAPLPDIGSGSLSIALLDNRKANAGALLAELGGRLEERLGAAIKPYTKPNASVAAAPEILDRIATHASFAVAASSD